MDIETKVDEYIGIIQTSSDRFTLNKVHKKLQRLLNLSLSIDDEDNFNRIFDKIEYALIVVNQL